MHFAALVASPPYVANNDQLKPQAVIAFGTISAKPTAPGDRITRYSLSRRIKLSHLSLLSFVDHVALVFGLRPADAQVGKGLNGTHYNLNIIGVPKGKTADMTNTDGHTIFVPLDGTAKIYYLAGSQFQVLDRNGTDGDGATVEVPSDPGGTSVCYDVYATALGKPNGNALVQAVCIIEGLIGACEDALQLSSFTVTRSKGQPKPENISDIFRASGCVDSNSSGSCDKGDTMFKNVWIFNVPQLTSYFWDYTNTDLKLMQAPFYPTVGGCGTIQTVQ